MDRYTQPDTKSAVEAKADAQRIAFAPMIFQAARAMRDLGILKTIAKTGKEGADIPTITEARNLSTYGVQVLLEMGLSIGLLWRKDDRYILTKTGACVLYDRMTNVNMDFVHDVCYQGLFSLDEAIQTGSPSGLRVFGSWHTIYEGLQELPPDVQKSWFAFDHFYSDLAFPKALPIVFQDPPQHILDVGGNTGRWALSCLRHNPDVKVTILDLPGTLQSALDNIAQEGFAQRIDGYAIDLLNPQEAFPSGADTIWMSQFLDCFSQEEILYILQRANQIMTPHSALYILETYWDRQPFEAGSFCLNSTSLYFTCMANGNSRMYHSKDMIRLVHKAGMIIEEDIDELGIGHTLFKCRQKTAIAQVASPRSIGRITPSPQTTNPPISEATRLQRGQLQTRLQKATARALQTGALMPIPTTHETIIEHGIPFQLRVVEQLQQKDIERAIAIASKEEPGPNTNPFAPYDPDLFVADICETHIALLNKYNVLLHHMLLITREFLPQDHWLDFEDFYALYLCMREFDGLAFYNGGEAAGASQPHRHLQLIPFPLTPETPSPPIEPLIQQHLDSTQPFSIPQLPFAHAFCTYALDPDDPSAHNGHIFHDSYTRLLRHFGFIKRPPPKGKQSAPYNLLITHQWMMLVPRSQEFFEKISVNALGFAGGLFARDEEARQRIHEVGPLHILRQVGCPPKTP